jgi:hypothetical protein
MKINEQLIRVIDRCGKGRNYIFGCWLSLLAAFVNDFKRCYHLALSKYLLVNQHHFLHMKTMSRTKIAIKSTLMMTYTLLDCLLFFSIKFDILSLYSTRDDLPRKVSSSSNDSGRSCFGPSIRLISFWHNRISTMIRSRMI